MFTNKSNSAAVKSPKTRTYRMAAHTRNSLDAKLVCDTKLWCEDFNIQQSASLIFYTEVLTVRALASAWGLPSAYERLGSRELLMDIQCFAHGIIRRSIIIPLHIQVRQADKCNFDSPPNVDIWQCAK